MDEFKLKLGDKNIVSTTETLFTTDEIPETEFRMSIISTLEKNSMDDIASHLKLSRATVRRWVLGDSAPHPLARPGIIAALNTPEPLMPRPPDPELSKLLPPEED